MEQDSFRMKVTIPKKKFVDLDSLLRLLCCIVCYGWSWSTFDRLCRLYGTPIPEEDHYLCRGCVSGKRIADRGWWLPIAILARVNCGQCSDVFLNCLLGLQKESSPSELVTMVGKNIPIIKGLKPQ